MKASDAFNPATPLPQCALAALDYMDRKDEAIGELVDALGVAVRAFVDDEPFSVPSGFDSAEEYVRSVYERHA